MEVSQHPRGQNSLLPPRSPRGMPHKPSFGSENIYSEDEEAEIYNILPAKVISTNSTYNPNLEIQNHFQDSLKASMDLEASQMDILTQADTSCMPKRRYSITADSSSCFSKNNKPCPKCSIF